LRRLLQGEVRGLLACLAVCGLLVTWLLSDALLSGGARVPGASDSEIWAFLWGGFWLEHALFEEGRFPLETLLLDFPAGGSLFLKDPISMLAAMPVQLVLGIPVTHILRLWCQLVAAGLGVYGVARVLGVRPLVATLAGLSFACCPHLLGEIYNGNTEAVNGAWCALWLWALLRLVKRPSVGTALVGGLLLTGLLSSNQYFAIAMALVSGPVLVAAFLRERGEGSTPARVGLALAGALLLGLTLFAPMAFGLLSSMDAPDQLTLLDSRIPLEPPWVTDLAQLVRPLASTGEAFERVPLQDIVYPGFLLVCSALLAPLLGPRGPWRWLWPAAALSALVLSLGPVLMVNGEVLRGAHGEPFYLPWAYLIADKPILGSMTLPHRMAVPAGLFLSLSAAFTLEGALRRGATLRGLRSWLLLALGTGILAVASAEQLLYPPYRIPLQTVEVTPPTHARLLAALPGDEAVLDLPFVMGRNNRRIYLWWQAHHGRPMAASLKMGQPPWISGQHPWLVGFTAWQAGDGPPPDPDPGLGPWLAEQGFGFVALHGSDPGIQPLASRADPGMRALLDASLGPGLVMPEGQVLYPLSDELRQAAEQALAGE
jgi:hypothetical protein